MMTGSQIPLTGDRAVTADVARGVCRHLSAQAMAPLLEFSLGNGRRADVAAMDTKGRLTIVEIKVSVSDFRSDCKWRDYLDYCDAFYFAVPEHFPTALLDHDDVLPDVTGIMIADRFGAAVTRAPAEAPMAGARRKAESLRFARKAAQRLHALLDPDGVL